VLVLRSASVVGEAVGRGAAGHLVEAVREAVEAPAAVGPELLGQLDAGFEVHASRGLEPRLGLQTVSTHLSRRSG